MAKGKKLPAKPTMAQAFNAAQGPAVNRPNAPIDYPGPGASPKARKTQAARMTAQANRGAATENLARRINLKKSAEIIKAQLSPNASFKKTSKGLTSTKGVITKKYTGAGSQAAKNKKKK